MKLLYFFGMIFSCLVLFWYLKPSRTAKNNLKRTKILTDIDEPIDFGYKTAWIAIKTSNKEKVAEILQIKNSQVSNWKSGIEYAYNEGIFITPQIGNWTLVVGIKLIDNTNLDGVNNIEKLLNKLSFEFGEAQSFATHRVIEYHHWIKSTKGKTTRTYAYIGESGINIKVFGNLTEEENGLNLFNSLSKEVETDEYWEREDLVYPNEDLVMKIAESWSLNPTQLTTRNDTKNELGIVAEI